jgi:hypothetical protein
VLIIAIVTLVAVGLLAGTLAALATPLFAHAEITRNLNDTSAAVDAGIQHGIQTLQSTYRAPSSMCQPPPPGLPPQRLDNPPVLNGYVPMVTCETIPAPPPFSSSQWATYFILTSGPPPGSASRVYSARAVVQVNNLTGATTVLSWKTCQDPGPC